MPLIRYWAAARAAAGVDEEAWDGDTVAELLAAARASRDAGFLRDPRSVEPARRRPDPRRSRPRVGAAQGRQRRRSAPPVRGRLSDGPELMDMNQVAAVGAPARRTTVSGIRSAGATVAVGVVVVAGAAVGPVGPGGGRVPGPGLHLERMASAAARARRAWWLARGARCRAGEPAGPRGARRHRCVPGRRPSRSSDRPGRARLLRPPGPAWPQAGAPRRRASRPRRPWSSPSPCRRCGSPFAEDRTGWRSSWWARWLRRWRPERQRSSREEVGPSPSSQEVALVS